MKALVGDVKGVEWPMEFIIARLYRYVSFGAQIAEFRHSTPRCRLSTVNILR